MHCFWILNSKHQPSRFQMKKYTDSHVFAIITIKLILEWWWKLSLSLLKAILSFQWNSLKWKLKEKLWINWIPSKEEIATDITEYLWTTEFHPAYFIPFHPQVKRQPQKGGPVTTNLLSSIPEGFAGCCSHYKQKPASTMGSTTKS